MDAGFSRDAVSGAWDLLADLAAEIDACDAALADLVCQWAHGAGPPFSAVRHVNETRAALELQLRDFSGNWVVRDERWHAAGAWQVVRTWRVGGTDFTAVVGPTDVGLECSLGAPRADGSTRLIDSWEVLPPSGFTIAGVDDLLDAVLLRAARLVGAASTRLQ